MKDNASFSIKEKKEIKEVTDLVTFTVHKFEDEKFPKYISNYKQYLGYVLDRLSDIEDWQTNISYPLAASIIDTEFANLFDFDFIFGIQEPVLKELCNQTFDYTSQGKIALKACLKECLICGEGFTKTGLLTKTENYSLLNGTKKIKVNTKKPTIEYLSIFNVFYDLSYGLNNSPYQITRVFNTGKYIKDKYSSYFENKNTNIKDIHKFIDTLLNKSESSKQRFSYYDYNPVKSINNYSNVITKSYNNKVPINTHVRQLTNELNAIDANNFYLVKDKKSYEIVEVLYNNKFYIYIDGNLLYHGLPLLEGELGLVRGISFNDIPGSGTSNGQIDNLAHLQSMLTGIWNAFLDNIKMQMSGMFAIYGNVPGLSRDGKVRFEKFKGIKMSPDAKIERLDFGLNDFSPMNVGQYIEQIVEKRAGVNGYLLGGQSKVERVSDSINLIHDQYKSKLTPVTDSIQMMMAGVSKSWILIYLKHFSEKQLKKLGLIFKVNDDGDLTVNNIVISDIINDENITFKFNSLRSIEKEKKRGIIKEIFQSLIQMKQLNPSQINELFKILLDDDFDLSKFTGIKGIDYSKDNTESVNDNTNQYTNQYTPPTQYDNKYNDNNVPQGQFGGTATDIGGNTQPIPVDTNGGQSIDDLLKGLSK